MRRNLLFALILIFISLRPALPAAKLKDLKQYVHQSWTMKDGLPQNTIRAIVQTGEGYIWMASQEGVVRFDGKDFVVFDRWNTPAIPHQEILDLAEGPDGTLWIATFGGLVGYRGGQFQSYRVEAGGLLNIIRCLYVEADGAVLIGTSGGGIAICRGGKVTPFALQDSLPAPAVQTLTRDLRGRLLAGTDRGLYIIDGGKTTRMTTSDGLPSETINALLQTRDGVIWVGTSAGLLRIEGERKRLLTSRDGLTDMSIQSLHEDRAGSLWIGTQRGGIIRLADGQASTLTSKDGLSTDDILDVLEDREGNIWVGTYRNGVNRLWEGRFLSFLGQQDVAAYLRVIRQSRDGTIWLGGEAGLGRIVNGNFDNSLTRLLPTPQVRALFEDSAGNLWIGTRDGAVRCRDGRCEAFTTRSGLSDNNIRAIIEDADGAILLGTSGSGVDRYRNGRFDNLQSLGVPRDVIRSLFRDQAGRIWIGGNAGLKMLAGGKVTAFSAAEGLPPEPVYSILEDSSHVLWFGTYGGGILRFQAGRFTLITVREGLFDNVAFQILEDRQGYFWISCNRGVYRVKRQDLNDFAAGKIRSVTCDSYGVADGMLSGECNGNSQPAGWRTQDQILWFPTTMGAVVIDPDNLKENRQPPPVVIEKVVIDKQNLDLLQMAVLPPGPGQLEFQYAGLSYIAPSKVKFRYRLEGFDPEWIDAGSRNAAYYTNTPPGTYTFRVSASNNDELWNEQGARFEFTLKPYFYRTRWFYLLVGLALAGGIFGGYRLRVYALLQRERELEQRLEASLARIKILDGLIPICANCKKIRDDKGYWSQMEIYIRNHSEATFSHGICPDCQTVLYGDLLKG